MKYAEYIEASKEYIELLQSQGKSDKTIENYTRVIKKFGEFWAENPDEDISVGMVERYAVNAMGSTKSQNTVRYHFTIIKSFFKWAKRAGKVAENPVHSDDMPSPQEIEYSDDELLTLDEITQVLNTKPSGMHLKTEARNRAIVVMLIQSGLRSDEIRSLALSDLDFDGNCVLVRFGKGNKQRFVPFPAQSQEAVKDYLASGYRPTGLPNNALLFGSTADENGHPVAGKWEKFSAPGMNLMVKKYVKSITGKNVHTHSLRHAAASLWDDMGASIRDIQLGFSHSSYHVPETEYASILNHQKELQIGISCRANGKGDVQINFVGSENEILQSCCSIVHATIQHLSRGNEENLKKCEKLLFQ